MLSLGCATTEQTKSIADHNAASTQMRKESLDAVFIMLKESFGKEKKLVEMKTPDGKNTLTVYRYDNGGVEQICQLVAAIVKDNDFVNFPDHPLVGFAREIKELGIGLVNSPAAAIATGGLAARWLADSVGDSAGHNTTMTSGGHMAGGSVEIPTTTTTTTSTETITNPMESMP